MDIKYKMQVVITLDGKIKKTKRGTLLVKLVKHKINEFKYASFCWRHMLTEDT